MENSGICWIEQKEALIALVNDGFLAMWETKAGIRLMTDGSPEDRIGGKI